jgi:hypothetical protein
MINDATILHFHRSRKREAEGELPRRSTIALAGYGRAVPIGYNKS